MHLTVKGGFENGKESESESQKTGPLVGGWSRAETPIVSDETQVLLHKAMDKLTGADYEPVAYLGSQVVAGTNHALLCRVTPATPDAVDYYAIVILYEDLNGNVEMTETHDSNRSTNISELAGGWFQPESPEMTEEAQKALEKAAESLTGASYTPLALLSTQVVAGINYCILCEITPVAPNVESHLSLVYVFADLNGNAEITDTVDFVE